MPESTESKILAILQDASDRLTADPFFFYIPIIPEDRKDIANEIDRALGPWKGQEGKSGVCVIALMPHANVTQKFQGVFGPFFDKILLMFRVLENRLVNEDVTKGVGIRALAIAEKIANRLHQFIPAGCTNPLTAAEPTIIIGNDPNNVSYDVAFWVSAGMTDVPPQLIAPTLALTPTDMFVYNYDVLTGGAPANGTFQLNNTPSLATQLFIHKEDALGGNVSPSLSLLGAGSVISIRTTRKVFAITIVSGPVDNISSYAFGITCVSNGEMNNNQETSLYLDRLALHYQLKIGASAADFGEAWIDQAAAAATTIRFNATSLDGVPRPELLAKFVGGSSFSVIKDVNNHAEYRISAVTIGTDWMFTITLYRLTGALPHGSIVTLTAHFVSGGSFAGSAVYWDQIASTPIPRTHHLYRSGEPVPFFEGELVKAKAFLAGYLASDVVSYVVP